jgi:hypothetical protein
MCSRGILGKFVKQIDIALDDGNPAMGTMQAMPNTAATATAGIPASGADGIDNDTPYTLCMGF